MKSPLETTPISGFARAYWLWWLALTLGSFLAYEILSLTDGHPENTFSNFVWVNLKIQMGESISQWSAGDLLVFTAYVAVFVLWLPWHFWFGLFR